ncbi:MAG: cytochrome c maturation protein CcmE [Dehalococcoidia bacterium]|nr:cytochrome c maturation protein CcmE [Dehalococcoidia bacterium]
MSDGTPEQVIEPEQRRSRWAALPPKRFLLVGVIALGALAYLGFVAFRGAAMYYLTVDELRARGDRAFEEQVRLAGKVVDGSAEKDPATNTLRFAMASESGAPLPVVYKGAVPDAFKQGAEVVVDGRLSRSGTFEADKLLVKCPSKYEAEESAAAEGGD